MSDTGVAVTRITTYKLLSSSNLYRITKVPQFYEHSIVADRSMYCMPRITRRASTLTTQGPMSDKSSRVTLLLLL